MLNRVFLGAVAVALSMGLAAPAIAQEPSGLRARQAALAEQLLDRPDDLDLMFAYAEVSLALKDLEAAISTFERMLIYRQDLPRVRLELAVAYYRLGSYEVANLYFDQVLADADTPPDVRARIARYQQEIDKRTAPNQISATAMVGITYATNANLGPDTGTILLGGLPATLVSGQSAEDFGVRVLVNATHIADLGGPNTDVWRTDASVFGLRYFEEEDGNLLFLRVRSGPQLALTDENFGPKIRPFIELSYLNSGNDSLYWQASGGVQYVDSIATDLALFAEATAGWRDFFETANDDEDAIVLTGRGGLAWRPLPDVTLRGTLIVEQDIADANFNTNTEVGARLSAQYQYSPGIAWIDRKWSLSGYTEVRGRFFSAAEPAVDPDTSRRDTDLRGGLSHLFSLRDGFGVQVEVDALLRESNIQNFDLDNVGVSISLQYRL